MLALPLEIGFDRGDQAVHTVCEIHIANRNPVANANLFRDLLSGHLTQSQRHYPLVQLDRVIHLLLTELRTNRLRADHKNERVTALDRAPQGSREHLRVANPLDVNPHILAPADQLLLQPLDVRLVLP